MLEIVRFSIAIATARTELMGGEGIGNAGWMEGGAAEVEHSKVDSHSAYRFSSQLVVSVRERISGVGRVGPLKAHPFPLPAAAERVNRASCL